jgi:predicted metal-dependent HD superfamily phosphohydrolase
MTSPEIELRRAWTHAVGQQHQADIDLVLAMHRQPHRHYHTATHVMWVLRHIDDLAPTCQVGNLDAVRVAALFHDAVYDPMSSTNEADSAQLADTVLGGIGWRAPRRLLVQRLILATAHHVGSTPASVDEEVLVDADLAILGSSPAEYTAYATAVRSEFAHLADTQWRTGRTAFLGAVIAAPHIFHTEAMRHRREARARANLAAELAALERGQ